MGLASALAVSSLGVAAAARIEVVIKLGELYLKQPNGTLKRLTLDGHVYSALVSPNGRWLAYNSGPMYESDSIEGHSGPSRVGVLALPLGAEIPVNMNSSSEAFSSEANWSYDSTNLAWTENAAGKGNDRLVIFTPKTGKLQRLLVPVAADGDGFPQRPIWNRSGQLATAGWLYSSDASVPVLYTYTLDGHWRMFKRSYNRPAIEFGSAVLTWLSPNEIRLVDRLGAAIRLDLATGQWK